MSITQQELSQLLLKAINLGQNGVAIVDAHNRFLFYNNAFARLFSFEPEPMLGRSFEELMTWMYENHRGTNIESNSLESWLDLFHRKFRSETYRLFSTDLMDGRWLLVSEQVTDTGHVIMLCSDISRQKEVELALRKSQKELERMALTDELTDLPNRRFFMSRLEEEIARSCRHNHALTVAMLDLDRFKTVNDRFGHASGDIVLKHFAGFIRQHLRISDVAGRLGGEEFAVILPETDLDNALCVLRRMNQALAEVRLPEVAEGFSYSFSGGVTALNTCDTQVSATWLLSCADKALYQAKETGRNQIVPYLPVWPVEWEK